METIIFSNGRQARNMYKDGRHEFSILDQRHRVYSFQNQKVKIVAVIGSCIV